MGRSSDHLSNKREWLKNKCCSTVQCKQLWGEEKYFPARCVSPQKPWTRSASCTIPVFPGAKAATINLLTTITHKLSTVVWTSQRIIFLLSCSGQKQNLWLEIYLHKQVLNVVFSKSSSLVYHITQLHQEFKVNSSCDDKYQCKFSYAQQYLWELTILSNTCNVKFLKNR